MRGLRKINVMTIALASRVTSSGIQFHTITYLANVQNHVRTSICIRYIAMPIVYIDH